MADVCAILESQLETVELDEWKAQVEEVAREPIRAYRYAILLTHLNALRSLSGMVL